MVSSLGADGNVLADCPERLRAGRKGAKTICQALACLVLVFTFSAFSSAGMAQDLSIGVLAPLGTKEAVARWQPTVDFLNARIKEATFKLVAYTDPGAMAKAARTGAFQYAITNPASYVEMEVDAGATKHLSLVNEWKGQPLIRFGSVIFTRKDEGDVLTLQDLRGKSLMAVGEHAFGGWEIVRQEFLQQDLQPDTYLGSLSFANFSQPAVVRAVRDGKVDAGVVRTGVLEQMAADLEINLNDFHVVAPRVDVGFPLLHSTELYPEWYFAALPSAPDDLTGAIINDLLAIDPQSAPAQQGAYYGWCLPLSDQPVHLLLKALHVPPYRNFGGLTFWQVVMTRGDRLIAVLIGLAALIATLLLALRRIRRLAAERADVIRARESELNFRTRARDQHAIVSITDSQGVITWVNDKFVEISGYSREELLGETHRILKSGAHDAAFYDDMWSTLTSGRAWHGEIQDRRKDGTFYWVQSTIVPHLDDTGKPFEYIAMRTDITEAKLAQTQLQLKQFFNLVRDEVYMFLPDTFEVSYSNMAAQKVLGLTAAEIDGRSIVEVIPNLSTDQRRDDLHALADGTRDAILCEMERTHGDGSIAWLECNIQFVRPEGISPRYVATIRNISKRKQAEATARQLGATLDHIPDQIFMFWPETKRFFYANETAKRRLGLSDAQLFEMTPSDIKGGLSVEECDAVLAPMIAGKTSQTTFVKKTTRDDGSFRATEYEIHHVAPDGDWPRFIAILRDATERERSFDEVRQLTESLDLIKNEVYVFWPDTFELIYVNDAATARTGRRADNWRGKKTNDFLSAKQQDVLQKRCAALIDGPFKQSLFEAMDRHGVPLEIYLHLIEPVGERPRFVAIYRDISEQKKADKAKTEFISTVSHELRTPLTSIKGALGLVLAGAGGELTTKQKSLLSIAHKNSDRLVGLINDILDIDKIEAGKMDFTMQPVDLGQLVTHAIAANGGYGAKYGVSYVTAAIDAPVLVNGNMDRLMQVMDNLLSNAAKFSRPGGQIEIAVTKQESHARISVTDHGDGVPEAARATLFDKFTQADSSDVREKGGSGLGLSITKAIVERHGGSLGFTTAVGVGSTFFFDLPNLISEVKATPTSDDGSSSQVSANCGDGK